MFRANKPGSVCATQANPFSGLARAAGVPTPTNALPGLLAIFMRGLFRAGKATLMVALATHWLGYVPKPCLARPMLFASLDCLDRGDLIGAGVRLREAVTRFVSTACDWYGVEVKVKFVTPTAMIRALREAGQCDPGCFETLLQCIELGNKAAHCGRIYPGSLRGCISLLFSMMDSEVYAGHERTPIATSRKADCDRCDDDGDDWKIGGVV